MNLVRAITTVGGFTLLSRVFGFLRDILIANFLGAGMIADAFFVAFRFPNLFRRLFAEGAFAAAFVPIFSGILEQEGRDKAQEFASQAFSVLAVILAGFVIIIEMIMPWAMIVLAPGFIEVEGKMELATELSRIAFPYLFFISLVSLQSGVLNSINRFAAAAAAPVLLNLTLIAAILVFTDFAETSGHALAWGVAAAGVVQFIWLVYHCRKEGFPVRFQKPVLSPKVRLLGKRILPVVFGASLYQINLLIGTILATLVSEGAVSYLYYADRVTQLPLGVVGVAVGTALLPMLSRQLTSGQEDAAMHSQNRGLEFALLLTLPAAFALIAIPVPIVAVLFERGAFDVNATLATAGALAAYATGLPAYVLIRVLTPGYFAREDTMTPVRIAAASMATNIILNLILMQYWGHIGIAYAASISAWLNALILALVLHRRGHLVIDTRLKRKSVRVLITSAAMAIGLYVGSHALDPWLIGGEVERALGLGILIGGGLIGFAVLAQITGAASWQDLKAFRKKRDAA